MIEGIGASIPRWNAAQPAGLADTRRTAELLAARLPPQLGVFAHLAYDFACFWHPEGRRLFAGIDVHTWESCERNPVRFLAECPTTKLVQAAQDPELISRATALWESLQEQRAQPLTEAGQICASSPVAFFCAEFGIYQSLPIYSGGLGILAGDLLKEASDRNFPMVGVGLYYRQGYFHQRLDDALRQSEYWLETPPEQVPIALVTDEWGIPVTVTVRLWEEDVVVQIWRAAIGRTSLYLLDADRPENSQIARWLTSRLYDSSREIRLGQYALLGIGGLRALRALGVDPQVLHLNEGHASLAVFELAREAVEAGAAPGDALDAARHKLVFTTHTPVPAGNETYSADELWGLLGDLPQQLGLSREDILRRGRIHCDDTGEPLGLTTLALRSSHSANGVSRVHGGVARGMWRPLWPDRPVEQVPIRHITNGVHLPTWMAAPMQELLNRYLGEGWMARAQYPRTWDAIDDIPDRELWAVRNHMRQLSVEYVRKRNIASHLSNGQPLASVEKWTQLLSPDILTMGFARRLATYKRIHLWPHDDPTRFRKLLLGDTPWQMLLAGKAHPLDDVAKESLQHASAMLGTDDGVRQRVAYLDDYNVAVATRLVAGCDVWLNSPRPPLEACGTSGMKAMFNGALNLSVLDGWWAEAYDGSNGWAITADPAENEAARDDRDRHLTLDLLEYKIMPLFYDRDADGVPRGWVRMIKNSLRSNGPRYCTGRMLRDYVNEVYTRE